MLFYCIGKFEELSYTIKRASLAGPHGCREETCRESDLPPAENPAKPDSLFIEYNSIYWYRFSFLSIVCKCKIW